MKNNNQQSVIIIGILQEALDKIQEALQQGEAPETQEEPRKAGRVINPCDKCGDELQEGNWGLYCHSCFLDRKESRKRK